MRFMLSRLVTSVMVSLFSVCVPQAGFAQESDSLDGPRFYNNAQDAAPNMISFSVPAHRAPDGSLTPSVDVVQVEVTEDNVDTVTAFALDHIDDAVKAAHEAGKPVHVDAINMHLPNAGLDSDLPADNILHRLDASSPHIGGVIDARITAKDQPARDLIDTSEFKIEERRLIELAEAGTKRTVTTLAIVRATNNGVGVMLSLQKSAGLTRALIMGAVCGFSSGFLGYKNNAIMDWLNAKETVASKLGKVSAITVGYGLHVYLWLSVMGMRPDLLTFSLSTGAAVLMEGGFYDANSKLFPHLKRQAVVESFNNGNNDETKNVALRKVSQYVVASQIWSVFQSAMTTIPPVVVQALGNEEASWKFMTYWNSAINKLFTNTWVSSEVSTEVAMLAADPGFLITASLYTILPATGLGAAYYVRKHVIPGSKLHQGVMTYAFNPFANYIAKPAAKAVSAVGSGVLGVIRQCSAAFGY